MVILVSQWPSGLLAGVTHPPIGTFLPCTPCPSEAWLWTQANQFSQTSTPVVYKSSCVVFYRTSLNDKLCFLGQVYRTSFARVI